MVGVEQWQNRHRARVEDEVAANDLSIRSSLLLDSDTNLSANMDNRTRNHEVFLLWITGMTWTVVRRNVPGGHLVSLVIGAIMRVLRCT
jgi:hypothetical protein